MTFFSRLHINPRIKGGIKLLSNPRAMHAAVEAAFPPGSSNQEGQRKLWRLDQGSTENTLYVLSREKPDFRHIIEQAGWIGQSWETTDYSRFVARLIKGQQWRFRLTANPVQSIPQGRNKRGKVVPHVTIAQQISWLQNKAKDHGFQILSDSTGDPAVTVTARQTLRFTKRSDQSRRQVSLRTAQFDGALKIIDADLFRHSLLLGIGRAKAYGCGLMTLYAQEYSDGSD